MKIRVVRALAVLAILGMGLCGCVADPYGYGYPYGPAYGYYPAPAGPVVVGGGWWGGGWHGDGGGWHGGGGGWHR